MNQFHLENLLNQLLKPHLALRNKEIDRLSMVISAMLLAGSSQMSLLSRQIAKEIPQPNRTQFLRRFFDSNLFTQQSVYHPLIAQALKGYHPKVLHLVIDRSTIHPHQIDLLSVGIVYRKRAIMLGWKLVPFGCTSANTQIRLFETISTLIPVKLPVIVHGDSEFGSVTLMEYFDEKKWDFILGQTSHRWYFDHSGKPCFLKDLAVSKRHTTYLENILWTKDHQYGPVTLFAFHSPHQNGKTGPRITHRYCITSLPKAYTLKQVGRRRWGTECMYKDFKSAGFKVDLSDMTDTHRLEVLILMVSTAYLWTTCVGRSLTKQGMRYQVDNKKKTLQLFSYRMGLDHSSQSLCSIDFYQFNSL